MFQFNGKRIRVAGIGKRKGLSPEVILASEQVGKALAYAGYGLITAGWPGVDYIVSRQFDNEMQRVGKSLSDYLTQYVPKGQEPDYKGGHIECVETGLVNWIESVKHSDAVVLIGGEGGTYASYVFALQEQKAVFPLAGTKGDAEKAYDHILECWESRPIAGIEKDGFLMLGHRIESESDATSVTEALVDLLARHFQYKTKSPGSTPKPSVNTEVVRQLLIASFDDTDLMVLCFDRFYPVYNEKISDGMSKSKKVQSLLDYCVRQGLLEALLELVKERNPYQYNIYAKRILAM